MKELNSGFIDIPITILEISAKYAPIMPLNHGYGNAYRSAFKLMKNRSRDMMAVSFFNGILDAAGRVCRGLLTIVHIMTGKMV